MNDVVVRTTVITIC